MITPADRVWTSLMYLPSNRLGGRRHRLPTTKERYG
jgi:hypothetical protein